MNKIKNIAKGLRVAIYGAGEVGLLIKSYIEQNRTDLKLVCFFDKAPNGDLEGLPVYSVKRICEFESDFDLVVIASCSNIQIMEIVLKHYGIKDYIYLDNFVLNNIDLVGVTSGEEVCTKPEENAKLKEVLEMFSSKESKKLFEQIVSAYNCKHCLKKMSNYLIEQGKQNYPEINEQYLDFIDTGSVKTMINGGAYDGGTTLLFLYRLENVEKIYSFEPMYPKFKCPVNDEIILKSGKVEVVQAGLLDKSCEVGFFESGHGSKVTANGEYYQNTTISTVSIDDFVEEKKIEKVDFIKMDVEGCELSALKGAEKTILNHRPQLAICIYHSFEELFDIPLYLKNLLSDYLFEVNHYSLNSNCESVIYAVPVNGK